MKYVITTPSPKMTTEQIRQICKKSKIHKATIYRALKNQSVASPRVAKAILGSEYKPKFSSKLY